MNKFFTSVGVSLRIWLFTAVMFAVGMAIYLVMSSEHNSLGLTLLAFIASLIGSIPALIGMLIMIPFIDRAAISWRTKYCRMLFLLFVLTIPYGLLAGLTRIFSGMLDLPHDETGFITTASLTSFGLFLCAVLASLITLRPIYCYFNDNLPAHYSCSDILSKLLNYTTKINTMDTHQQELPATHQPNKILIKGLITGGLILLMLIPTIFIHNLIEEREARQKEVVKEVSSKWATAQTLSAPFLVVPYTDTFINTEGKTVAVKSKLVLLANGLQVSGKIIPEERPRSIYKVLLYKTDIIMNGDFKVNWPADINLTNVDYTNAKLCFSLSDFKGIEEDIYINFNGQKLLMTPGLPVKDFGQVGLSVPVNLSPEGAVSGLPFNMQVKLKGSEQLHFIPMSASSKFQVRSVWPSPSFDGDMLPNERSVDDSGFTARWNFNQANLPFARVMRSKEIQDAKMEFGVSLVQPADQYNKTMRSVKYAILFIGLTFAFFFIIELLQKKNLFTLCNMFWSD